MGKKSKKKAKVGAASAPVNVRCFGCFKTVKISEGKGHTCPGCLQIYCWMCEERKFGECLNSADCVRPCRRCENCTSGISMFKAMKELGISCEKQKIGAGEGSSVSRASVNAFFKAVSNSDKLTLDILPRAVCRNRADGSCLHAECLLEECHWCVTDKKVRRLLYCVDCGEVVKCTKCGSVDKGSENRINAAIDQLCKETDWQLTADDIRGVYEDVRPGAFFSCGDCGQFRCMDCISARSWEAIAKRSNKWEMGMGYDFALICDKCYFAKKPCTNPTCPNKVGVPTMRCGGCHISRYCSKECQAMDFADHIEKCERMQQKLAAKAGKTMNK